MEKTRDNLKGTMNHLTPVLHETGLQNKIRSITNHTQSPSVSFADPISESIPDNSALSYTSTSPEPLPVPPPQSKNSVEHASTLSSTITYSGPWDETIMMDIPADVLNQKKTPLIQNQLQFQKHWNTDPCILTTSPLPSVRNAMHFILNNIARTSLAPIVGLLPLDTGQTSVPRRLSRNVGGRKMPKKVMIKILHIPGTIVTDIMTSLEKKTVT